MSTVQRTGRIHALADELGEAAIAIETDVTARFAALPPGSGSGRGSRNVGFTSRFAAARVAGRAG